MGSPRTLPPLVRGKVIATLDFFIDEIIITKNVSYLTENLDFLAQVRWWGEILPASIRPKILQLHGKIIKCRQPVEAYYHSVHYEVKTSISLLKFYLKTCEVIELSVCETVKNYVIGSAFLKNLNNLLNRNNDFISLPIIDYTGEEIGQMKIHIDFFENPQDDDNQIYKNKIVGKNLYTPQEGVPELLQCKHNYIFPAEKTIIYDGCSKISSEIQSNQNLMQNNNVSSSVLSNSESKTTLKNYFASETKELSECIFPEVYVSSDLSKVLKFDADSKIKKPGKNNKSKLVNKGISDSLLDKNKARNRKSYLGVSINKDQFSKKTVPRMLSLKKPKLVITNQTDSKAQCRKPSDEDFSTKNLEVENFLPTCNNKMVFDYLLGSVMTKENEESAMEYFKKMSPSCDIVSSINNLCVASNETEFCTTKCIKSSLCFDLNNPIERNYYEKFFVKNNSTEIAEFLNEPQNSSVLQKWKSIDRNNQNDNFEIERFVREDVTRKSDDFPLGNQNRMNKITNNCARCKYYKKLDELDTIIESLKHFEKNMLKQEKRLQLGLEDNLSEQGCKMPDR